MKTEKDKKTGAYSFVSEAEEWLKENNCMNPSVHLKAGIKTSEAMQAYADQQVNQTLEKAIVFLGKQFPEYGPKEFSIREIRRLLESLKIKQP